MLSRLFRPLRNRLDLRYATNGRIDAVERRLAADATASATRANLAEIEHRLDALTQRLVAVETGLTGIDERAVDRAALTTSLAADVDELRTALAETHRLVGECNKAIDHLLPAEVAVLQRLDGIDATLAEAP